MVGMRFAPKLDWTGPDRNRAQASGTCWTVSDGRGFRAVLTHMTAGVRSPGLRENEQNRRFMGEIRGY